MSEKVLVVDDEHDIADLLEVYLQNENYIVYKFYSAREALDCIENQEVDLGVQFTDEPTGNLDSKTSQDVLSLLKVTSQKFAQTIVMITHNEEIAQMADRIIRIEDGRIVSEN